MSNIDTNPSHGKNLRGLYIWLVLGWCLLLGSAAFSTFALTLQISFIFTVTEFVIGVRLLYFLSNRLVGPTVIFVASLYLTHYGQFWLEVFNANGGKYFGKSYDEGALTLTILLSYLGTSGALLGGIRGLNSRAQSQRHNSKVTPDRIFLIAGSVLLILSLPSSLRVAQGTFALSASGTYASYYTRDAVQGLDNLDGVLSGFLPCAAIVLLLGSSRSRCWSILAVLVLLLSTALSSVSGRRTETLLPILAFVWLIGLHRNKNPRLPSSRVPRIKSVFVVTSLALILIFVSPLMSRLRLLRGEQKFSVDTISTTLGGIDNPVISQINETGFSAITVTDTLNLVPNVRNFDLGLGYARAAVFSLPRFLSPVDPLGGYGPPSVWLIQQAHPALLGTGLFYGYSAIAESYLQFGWVGGFVCMFVFTNLLGFADCKARCGRHYTYIICCSVGIVWLPHFARGHLMELIRPILWHGGGSSALITMLSRANRSPAETHKIYR